MAVRVPINGDTLRWARLLSHLEARELGSAAGVSATQIHAFESGEAEPTYRQMVLMAKRLDRPFAFFLGAAPDKADVPQAADFRGRSDRSIPAALAREMKRAEAHRVAMLDLTGPPRNPVKLQPMDWGSLVARAEELRRHLGLNEGFTPPETQANAALNFWRGLLEDHGYMVFQTTGIEWDVFRGLSLHHSEWPVIVLNGADSANGRIFTLFHEVAHLANRTSGLCVLNEAVDQEAICNAFAANVLMPQGAVRRALADARPENWVTTLSIRFKVSSLAAAIRLRRMGKLSEAELEAVRADSDSAWNRNREAQSQGEGFPPPWRLKYRDLGPAYIGTVARAIEQDRIDWVDATYLLNARLPMVEQLMEEFYRSGGAR